MTDALSLILPLKRPKKQIYEPPAEQARLVETVDQITEESQKRLAVSQENIKKAEKLIEQAASS